LAAEDDDGLDDTDIEDSGLDEEEDDFVDDDGDDVDTDFDEFEDDADVDDDGDDDIDAVVELTSKEQSARSLEIRRAIEERLAERRFHEDIDYLDFDPDD